MRLIGVSILVLAAAIVAVGWMVTQQHHKTNCDHASNKLACVLAH